MVGLLLFSCTHGADEGTTDADGAAQALPPGHVPISGSAPSPSAPRTSYSGTVLETMDAGGYTYAYLAIEGTEAWFAGPATPLEKGDTVLVANALPMEEFSSPSLDRTFDVIYFLRAFDPAAAASSDVPSGGTVSPPAAANGAVAERPSRGTVSEVLTGGGYTYVRVDVGGESLWLAGPLASVSEGQIVSWTGGMRMDDFASTSLERTFETILFVEGMTVVR